MSIKVGLNGFGRIGRAVLRLAQTEFGDDIEIVALNARANTETLVHLFKYDSCYGKFNGEASAVGENVMQVNGKEIKIFRCNDPEDIPWGELGVDIVVESTGIFKDREKASKHIKAGAKKVIITAPGKNEDVTIVMGVNEEDYDPANHHIISNASCTTNCLAPFAKVLDDKFGIEKGLMTTVHAYTNDQRILDKTHKDLRRARAAGESIIPTTTGAAKAVSKVLPQLEGKLNGFALRVPTPTVSLVDLVCELKKPATVEEINAAFKEASEGSMKGILGYSEEPLVSVDYKGDERSSIVDGLSTLSMGDKMFKILSWYDNEWGYSARTVDLVKYVAKSL
ncbi:type I glyceraldehyde-3-phosphate dehydrogenase [Peptacetobacter hiranonis]|uniref:Glyceraldehyde-3-phosphate dehydrogenase n=1 Tax=Peptacetobacter hiranonis (strain DSM 13275 / JCM 10541 / KCTC 15199 / TO-931) TaxID=500633 RepID=B6FWJ4_PEPHT|nr:type I glyceraldehyde-3-phosphate dehydrogenase [Peptacetobacter hiranonis]EEA86101.1 glyceraldehyde-3-phosphate dehydrogenase, type I [Peptacetobacter hiranonis DSM 13275]QEK21209.1 Glyceraldehyde-3-phosphate dehydrogenase [Peptacetobacter hiranonis]